MAQDPKTPVVAPVVAAPSQQDANQRAAEALRLRQERERAAAPAGEVTLVATTSFTIVSDPAEPNGRVVRYGEEFTVPKADLPRYEGRGREKVRDEDGDESDVKAAR